MNMNTSRTRNLDENKNEHFRTDTREAKTTAETTREKKTTGVPEEENDGIDNMQCSSDGDGISLPSNPSPSNGSSSLQTSEDDCLPSGFSAHKHGLSPLDFFSHEEVSKQFDARLAEIDMEMSDSGDLSTAQALSDVYAWNYLNGSEAIPNVPPNDGSSVVQLQVKNIDEINNAPKHFDDSLPSTTSSSSAIMNNSCLSETEKSILSQTDSEEICEDFYAADNELLASQDLHGLTYDYLGYPQLAVVSSSDLSDFKSPLFSSANSPVRVSTDSLDKNAVLDSCGSVDRFVTCTWETPKSNYTLMFDGSPVKTSDENWDPHRVFTGNSHERYTTWAKMSESGGSRSHSASEHSDGTPSRSSGNTSQHTAIHQSDLATDQSKLKLNPSTAQKLDLYAESASPGLTTWGQLKKTYTTWKDVHRPEEIQTRSDSMPSLQLREKPGRKQNETQDGEDNEDKNKRHSFTLFEIFQRMKSHESMESEECGSPGSYQNQRWSPSPMRDSHVSFGRNHKTVATSPLRDFADHDANSQAVQTSFTGLHDKMNKSLQTSIHKYTHKSWVPDPGYNSKSCSNEGLPGMGTQKYKDQTVRSLPTPRKLARSDYFAKNVLPPLDFLQKAPPLPPALEKLFRPKNAPPKPPRLHSVNCCDWLNNSETTDEKESKSEFKPHVHHLFEDARVICQGEGKAYLVLPAKRFTNAEGGTCSQGCQANKSSKTNPNQKLDKFNNSGTDLDRHLKVEDNLQLPFQSSDRGVWNLSFESSSSSGIDPGSHSCSPRPMGSPSFRYESYPRLTQTNKSKERNNLRSSNSVEHLTANSPTKDSPMKLRRSKSDGDNYMNNGPRERCNKEQFMRRKPQNPQVRHVIRRPLKSCLRKKAHSRSFSFPSVSQLVEEREVHSLPQTKQRPVSEFIDRDDALLEFLSQPAKENPKPESVIKSTSTPPVDEKLDEADMQIEKPIEIDPHDQLDGSDDSDGKVKKSVSFAKEIHVLFRSPLCSPHQSPVKKHVPSSVAPDLIADHGVINKVKPTDRSGSLHNSGGSSDSDAPPAEFDVSPSREKSPEASFAHVNRVTHERELVLSMLKAAESILGYFMQTKDPLKRIELVNLAESPEVGDLIINTFCPVLYKLVTDGQKPHIFTWFGQVKNNVWLLVEDSCELGPSTRALNDLVCSIQSVMAGKSAEVKFCAFVFGLLNIKSLDFWLQHLRDNSKVLSKHYDSVSFMTSSNASTQKLFADTLTALQPLTVLPFKLELDTVLSMLEAKESARWLQSSLKLDSVNKLNTVSLLNQSIDSVSLKQQRAVDNTQAKPVRKTQKVISNNEMVMPKFHESFDESAENRSEKGFFGSLAKHLSSLTSSMPIQSPYKEGITEYCFDTAEVKPTTNIVDLPERNKITPRNEGLPEIMKSPTVSVHSDVVQPGQPSHNTQQPGGTSVQSSKNIFPSIISTAVASDMPKSADSPQPARKSQQAISEKDGGFFSKLTVKAKRFNQLGPGLMKMFDSLLTEPRRKQNTKSLPGLSQSVVQNPPPPKPPRRHSSLDFNGRVDVSQESSVGAEVESAKNGDVQVGTSGGQPTRYIKCLCHHMGSDDGELSFDAGDYMSVIKMVDKDRLWCCFLGTYGLVSVTMTRSVDEFELFMFLHGDFYT